MDALKVALNGVILNILVVLGLVGNICAIIVLTKPRMKSSLNYLFSPQCQGQVGCLFASCSSMKTFEH